MERTVKGWGRRQDVCEVGGESGAKGRKRRGQSIEVSNPYNIPCPSEVKGEKER